MMKKVIMLLAFLCAGVVQVQAMESSYVHSHKEDYSEERYRKFEQDYKQSGGTTLKEFHQQALDSEKVGELGKEVANLSEKVEKLSNQVDMQIIKKGNIAIMFHRPIYVGRQKEDAQPNELYQKVLLWNNDQENEFNIITYLPYDHLKNYKEGNTLEINDGVAKYKVKANQMGSKHKKHGNFENVLVQYKTMFDRNPKYRKEDECYLLERDILKKDQHDVITHGPNGIKIPRSDKHNLDLNDTRNTVSGRKLDLSSPKNNTTQVSKNNTGLYAAIGATLLAAGITWYYNPGSIVDSVKDYISSWWPVKS